MFFLTPNHYLSAIKFLKGKKRCVFISMGLIPLWNVTEIHQSLSCQVREEMQREREDDLRSRANSLAMQMAALHYQKAERTTKVLETSRATLTLSSLLLQNLRERKSLDRQNLAQCIQNHCLVGSV